MQRGTFLFDGVSSTIYEMVIQDRPDRQMPVRRVTTYNVSGRNGTIYQSLNEYDNTQLILNLVFLSDPDSYRLEQIAELFDTTDYVDFVPYFDDRHIYKVKVIDKIVFKNKDSYNRATTIDLTLSVFPIKKIISSLNPITLTSQNDIYNISNLIAKPKITLYGNGNLMLKVNDKVYNYTDVHGKIVIDSDNIEVFDENNNPAPQKALGLEFPFFEKGKNTIDTNAVKYEVIKNFGRLAV